MNKLEKINYIKGWLQKFGNRDNDKFSIEINISDNSYELSLLYNFNEFGVHNKSFDLYINDSLDVPECLDEIIFKLKSIYLFHHDHAIIPYFVNNFFITIDRKIYNNEDCSDFITKEIELELSDNNYSHINILLSDDRIKDYELDIIDKILVLLKPWKNVLPAYNTIESWCLQKEII